MQGLCPVRSTLSTLVASNQPGSKIITPQALTHGYITKTSFPPQNAAVQVDQFPIEMTWPDCLTHLTNNG